MRQFAALASLLGLAGCQPTLPPYTVHVPPRLVDIRPKPSVVFLRTDVGLDPLQSAIEGAMPAEVSGSRKLKLALVGEVDARWHLLRQPTVVQPGAEGLMIEVALIGEIEVTRGSIQCHAADSGLVFHAAVRPALRAEGELALDGLKLRPRPKGNFKCSGLPIALPMGTVLEWISTPLVRPFELALQAARLPLGPLVVRGLDALSIPRALTLPPKQLPACLDLDARSLVVAPFGASGKKLVLKLGAEVAPRLSLGPCPERHQGPHALVAMMMPLGNTFEVTLAVAVPYDDLSAQITPLLVGQSIGSGSNKVTIEAVELGDAGGRVLARVRVSGAIAGILYLWGTPSVDERDGRLLLQVPDLEVSVETRSATQKIRLGIWQLVDGGLRTFLRKKLTLDVTARVAEVRAALTRRIDLGHGVALTTELSRLIPGEVTSEMGALVLHPVLVGSGTVTIDGVQGWRGPETARVMASTVRLKCGVGRESARMAAAISSVAGASTLKWVAPGTTKN